MALVLAVARRGVVRADVSADRRLWRRLGSLWHNRGPGRSLRDFRGRPRDGDDLLHRHDLCVAEADPSVAQFMGCAQLFCARTDERLSRSRFPRTIMGAASDRGTPSHFLVVLAAWWSKERYWRF